MREALAVVIIKAYQDGEYDTMTEVSDDGLPSLMDIEDMIV